MFDLVSVGVEKLVGRAKIKRMGLKKRGILKFASLSETDHDMLSVSEPLCRLRWPNAGRALSWTRYRNPKKPERYFLSVTFQSLEYPDLLKCF